MDINYANEVPCDPRVREFDEILRRLESYDGKLDFLNDQFSAVVARIFGPRPPQAESIGKGIESVPNGALAEANTLLGRIEDKLNRLSAHADRLSGF